MKKMEFSQQETAALVRLIQAYFEQEDLSDHLGSLAAEELLEFFSTKVGAYYYNRGLGDARAVLMSKVDEFNDAMYGLEQPTELSR